MSETQSKQLTWAGRTVAFAILIVLWELVRVMLGQEKRLLPSASEVALYLLRASSSQIFWQQIGSTIIRALCGFSVAILVGIPLGVGVGAYPRIGRVLLPLIDFFRSIPVSTLYPCFVLIAGVGDRSKIAMIGFAATSVVAVNTAYGVCQARPARFELLRLLGASKYEMARHVLFWEALPHTVIGVRIALSLSLIVAVLTEMFMGAYSGIGQQIMEAYSVYALPRMYAYIVTAGVLGTILNAFVVFGESHFVHWSAKA